jgi:hypothetical protein
MSEADAHGYQGLWTLTFEGGALAIEDPVGVCNGSYSLADGRISLHLGSDPACGTTPNTVLFVARWSMKDDELQFEQLAAGIGHDTELLQTLFGDAVWVKVD